MPLVNDDELPLEPAEVLLVVDADLVRRHNDRERLVRVGAALELVRGPLLALAIHVLADVANSRVGGGLEARRAQLGALVLRPVVHDHGDRGGELLELGDPVVQDGQRADDKERAPRPLGAEVGKERDGLQRLMSAAAARGHIPCPGPSHQRGYR